MRRKGLASRGFNRNHRAGYAIVGRQNEVSGKTIAKINYTPWGKLKSISITNLR
jgi:hypothetical protein